jgi:hypothetical protein
MVILTLNSRNLIPKGTVKKKINIRFDSTEDATRTWKR